MKVAWFGHKAKGRGDSLTTYCREIIKELEARGAEVIFFYRSHKAEEDPENARWGPFNLFDQDIVSAPGVKGIIDEVVERERVDVAYKPLSFSLLDFRLSDICHDRSTPMVATFHFPYDRRLPSGEVVEWYSLHANEVM